MTERMQVEKDLVGMAEYSRRELANRMASLADKLIQTTDRLRRASNLEELSVAFNPLGEIQDAHAINSVCGRLGAHLKLLERLAPATKLGPVI